MTTPTLPTLRAQRGAPLAVRTDLLLVPVADGDLGPALRPLGRALATSLQRRAKAAEFRGRSDELLLHQTDRQGMALLGIGAGGVDGWRRAGARGRKEAERLGARRVGIWAGALAERTELLAALAEGFLLAGYRFDRYRSERRGPRVEQLVILGPATLQPAALRAVLDGARTLVTSVFEARDLVNEPPSVATPRFVADYARRLARETKTLTAEVWDVKRIEKEQLTGLLAVAKGSHEEPRFVILRYAPPNARRKVAIIGKGITFDSGGLSLKPAKSMETMKYDMAGGAAVLAATAAAAALEIPVEVTAYVPATENLPGGRAQKPGDVIRYANGKTVEVLNTDAEGRLVLADALVLAARARPDVIVDLATLTGAARVALGSLYACVLGNDQAVVDALVAAGRATGEQLWQLPLVREYRDDLKSSVADLKNVGGGGEGGTIVAALFLGEFVDGVPWAHLDIAGPAFAEKEQAIAPRGATGYGVRLLVEYLRGLAAQAA